VPTRHDVPASLATIYLVVISLSLNYDLVTMSACDFLVDSCSSTELHTVPRIATTEIISSPSLPDVNDSSLREAVGTALASWCPSFSHVSRKCFAGGQKFRSPISVALMVLKAQILTLKRRVHLVEVECDSLKHSNGTLQSRNASLSGDLLRLRADYNTLLCDRKKRTLAAEQDQQKIRALTSDIDNAQQFIMAMVDIKLHENFLLVAANETMANSEDAEKSLAIAIAQEADRDGSLWSRILTSVVDYRSANSYSAAVDLALQAKDLSLGDDLTFGARKAANVLPEFHRVTSQDSERSCDLDESSPFASPSKIRTQPPTPLSAPRQSPTMPIHRLSPASTANPNPTKSSGLGKRYNRRISPPAQIATSQLQVTKTPSTRPYSTPKIEDAKVKPTRKKTTSRKRTQPQNQNHMKNSDKRKGIIITSDVAMASISVIASCPLRKTETEQLLQKQKSVDSKGNTTLFTALSSLERICASLSSSDLGSLEETSDDDESRSRASDDTGGSLDRRDRTVGEGPRGSPHTDSAAEKDQSSICLVPDCPELSPSISTSPPSTPLGLAWTFYSEGGQTADTSPTSTDFSDIIPIVKQDPTVYEDSPSFRSSLNLSKFPVVSGFAKRLSRAITKTDDNSTEQCVPHVNNSSSSLENTHLRSGPTTTVSKTSSPKISKSTSSLISPGRQNSSTKSTIPSKKTTAPEKTFAVAEGPPSVKRGRGATDIKSAAETTPTSNTPQESNFSMGRNFFRRLSNIPGSVSRTRFGPATSESPKGTGAGPNRTRIFLVPSAPVPTKARSRTADATLKAPTLTAANGTTQASAKAVAPPRTKPRSNTINDYSPAKSSPLTQNVITASSGRPDSSSSWKRLSVQVVLSTHTKSTTDKTVPAAAAAIPPRPTERRPSAKRQRVKNGDLEPTMTPTAAFMKPVNKSAKVAKRMTNSIKPLIPTWNAGSSSSSSPQCSNMFRNSLSMIVR